MVRGDVVGDEVEQEGHAPVSELLAGHREPGTAAEGVVDDVAPDAVGGAGDVGSTVAG